MSIPFRERNPVVVGAVSLAVVLGLLLLAFNAEKLPIIGGGDTYYADFKEAGGLKADDEVRIAGVRVGKVDSVSLDGSAYRVPATIHNIGDKSAKDVVVHVELVRADKDSAVAETDITVDWLPGKSSRDVMAVLTPKKSDSRLRARAEARGYVVP